MNPEGTQLIADFNTYFGALEREASQLGSKLYQLIDQAMADGFIDADESQAIPGCRKADAGPDGDADRHKTPPPD